MVSVKKAWKFKKLLKSNNIDEVLKGVNEVVKIYDQHKQEVQKKCELKDFKDVEGIDFNVWAYTQLYRIESLYFDLKSKYYDLHFDKYHFNAY